MKKRPLALVCAAGAACLTVLLSLRAPGQAVVRERVEISAPILPRTTVIYQPFPGTLEGEKAMAHDAALLFDGLLEHCAPLYPKIALAPSGVGLSDQQLATNYVEVARCSYEQYGAKPYWIPKLIDDVDICGTEMGAGWRLPSEADLASLSESDFQAVADKWNHPSADVTFSSFFSSLAIWVRGTNGSIEIGTLAPGGADNRVRPIAPEISLTNHYEGDVSLRCIRRTDLPPDGAGASGGAQGGSGTGGGSEGGGGGASADGGGGGRDAGGDDPDVLDAAGAVTVCDGFTLPADHPNAARDYDTHAAGMVNDAVTGLMWESAATQGGTVFREWDCTRRNTGAQVDWRRPTLLELVSIVDFASENPAIDQAGFPGTPADYFASATPLYVDGRPFGPEGYGWSVDFGTGLWTNGLPPDFRYRCVRDVAPRRCYRAAERYQPTASSSVAAVFDAFSGLTWQRGLAPEMKTWSDAKAYCEALGGGYRLPGVKELLSIMDLETASRPAIDPVAFPGTPSGSFWSGTPAADGTPTALATDFTAATNGITSALDQLSVQYVRCVR